MKCHNARVGILRSLVSNPSSDGLAESVLGCLRLAQPIADMEGMVRRFAPLVDRELMTKAAVSGVSRMNHIPSRALRVVDKWDSQIASSRDEEYLTDLARIHAYHGLTEDSRLINTFKKHKTDPILFIRLFRKLKSERKSVWSLYMSLDQKIDPTVLTDSIATAVALNGWYDRVDTVLDRRDRSVNLKPETAARLLRAMSHHAVGPEVEHTVKRVLSEVDDDGLQNPEVRSALVMFYLINGRYRDIEKLLGKSGPIDSPIVTHQILKKLSSVGEHEMVFQVFALLKTAVNEAACSLAIDLAVGKKSTENLLLVLDVMHLRKIKINPIQEARIRDMISDRSVVTPRIGKRISTVLELIVKTHAQPSFITS